MKKSYVLSCLSCWNWPRIIVTMAIINVRVASTCNLVIYQYSSCAINNNNNNLSFLHGALHIMSQCTLHYFSCSLGQNIIPVIFPAPWGVYSPFCATFYGGATGLIKHHYYIYPHGYMYSFINTPGWREAITVKCLALGIQVHVHVHVPWLWPGFKHKSSALIRSTMEAQPTVHMKPAHQQFYVLSTIYTRYEYMDMKVCILFYVW